MGSVEHKAYILKKIDELRPFVEKLKSTSTSSEKEKRLLEFPKIIEKIKSQKEKYQDLTIDKRIVFFSLLAIDQEREIANMDLQPLCHVEAFFIKMGGLIGYHLKVLEMIAKNQDKNLDVLYEKPVGFDLEKKSYIDGLQSLKKVGEIYVLGGLGDRLKLMDTKGEPLPAALLPFLGRSLLEILIRDLEAREYLYDKLFEERFFTPLALMTSLEKENEAYIRNLLQKNDWYGRSQETFHLFGQILVPVIDSEGNWVVKDNGDQKEFLLHPGGHGAIWKAAETEKIYQWFQDLGKKAFLIRQINNPVAGLDGGLIAFIGLGMQFQKTLGIASCKRVAHAAEGVLVNIKKENQWSTINIEYTDFQKHGIEDIPDEQGYSQFYTNTNLLYVDLEKILPIIKEHPVPDVLLNMKTKVGDKLVGRLESLMQNITHHVPVQEIFITYNERSKTISTAKRAFEEGKALLETPEGAFYDLMQENLKLANDCGLLVPESSSSESYLQNGPSTIFLYHPALGPFYDIIKQKIRSGQLFLHSELQLEIAELFMENLHLDGSLMIETENVSRRHSGFCFLKNIIVKNKGIDRQKPNCYWKNHIIRKECCQIALGANSELIAENVSFCGDIRIEIPSNMRWIAFEQNGKLFFKKEKIEKSLSWTYQLEENTIKLNLNHIRPLS